MCIPQSLTTAAAAGAPCPGPTSAAQRSAEAEQPALPPRVDWRTCHDVQQAAPSLPADGEVHVWSCDLHHMPADGAAWLDAGERQRAQRLQHDVHRRRFIAAHAWMRRILGLYLRQPPQSLRWATGPLGKPALASAAPIAALHFNLSHTEDKALLAVSRTAAVGIDIEAIRPCVADAALRCAVLTASEHEALLRLPGTEHDAAFYRCWTRKEAWLKALGLGLSIEPCTLHVGLAAACQRVRWPGMPHALTLTALPAPAGHAAALAVEGGLRRVVQFDTTGLAEARP